MSIREEDQPGSQTKVRNAGGDIQVKDIGEPGTEDRQNESEPTAGIEASDRPAQ